MNLLTKSNISSVPGNVSIATHKPLETTKDCPISALEKRLWYCFALIISALSFNEGFLLVIVPSEANESGNSSLTPFIINPWFSNILPILRKSLSSVCFKNGWT